MSTTLRGSAQLKARFKAWRTKVAGPAIKGWQKEANTIAQGSVATMAMPYSKGDLLRSIDIKRTATGRASATTTKGVIVASYHAYFVDAGPKPHYLNARSSTRNRAAREGRTIFSRKARKMHPGYAARPFRVKTTMDAYRRTNPLDYVIKAWNEAA